MISYHTYRGTTCMFCGASTARCGRPGMFFVFHAAELDAFEC